MREQENDIKQSKGTGAIAIADAVEESAVVCNGAEVAPAVAGGSLELHVHKESSTEHEHDRALEAVQAIEALSWSTGAKDTGVLNGLLASLPEWSIKEQILAYRASGQTSIIHKGCRLLVEPTL